MDGQTDISALARERLLGLSVIDLSAPNLNIELSAY